MKIEEFAKEWLTDKRSIDYWTNVGLLHPEINELNGYRDYGDCAKEEIKLILIARALNIKGVQLKEAVEYVKRCPSREQLVKELMIEGHRQYYMYKWLADIAKTLNEE